MFEQLGLKQGEKLVAEPPSSASEPVHADCEKGPRGSIGLSAALASIGRRPRSVHGIGWSDRDDLLGPAFPMDPSRIP